jgi:hypothetical protein
MKQKIHRLVLGFNLVWLSVCCAFDLLAHELFTEKSICFNEDYWFSRTNTQHNIVESPW